MDFTKCPYNPSHQFASEKYQWHIQRCKDKKALSHKFTACKYNRLHIFLKEDIQSHETICPYRKATNRHEQVTFKANKLLFNSTLSQSVSGDRKQKSQTIEKINITQAYRDHELKVEVQEQNDMKTLQECQECQNLLSIIKEVSGVKNQKMLKRYLCEYKKYVD